MKNKIIKKVTQLQQTRYLNFYHAVYENKFGAEKNWYIASRKDEETIKKQLLEGKKDETDAVCLVAIHQEEKKLVLIKEFRIPLNDYVYELPAGLIDEGEEMFEAAKRELKEETGLELTKIDYEKSCRQCYLSPGMTDESVGIVHCLCTGKASQEFLEADENIQPMLVSKEEAREILASGAKMDVKALLILQQFVMEK